MDQNALKMGLYVQVGEIRTTGGVMTHPSTQPYSAGAHGLRRILGQSVNLAHLIWRTPRAPALLQGAPPVVFRAGL